MVVAAAINRDLENPSTWVATFETDEGDRYRALFDNKSLTTTRASFGKKNEKKTTHHGDTLDIDYDHVPTLDCTGDTTAFVFTEEEKEA